MYIFKFCVANLCKGLKRISTTSFEVYEIIRDPKRSISRTALKNVGQKSVGKIWVRIPINTVNTFFD